MHADMKIEVLQKYYPISERLEADLKESRTQALHSIHKQTQEIENLKVRIVELEIALGNTTSRELFRIWESRNSRYTVDRMRPVRRFDELSALAFGRSYGKLKSAYVSEQVLYAVVVSAVSLLLLVYQYLIGRVDKGGTLTCSTGSFQFRATYTSIVLVEGAYVWIKFRDVSPSGYRRPVKDKLSGTIKLSKPEARYTPPGQSGDHLYLGVCTTDEEARIKKQIAAFYYGRGQGTLDLGHGHHFQIPSAQMEQERLNLSVKEKRKWVRDKVREVYELFDKAQKANFRASLDEVEFGEYYKCLEKFLELEPSSDMMFDSQPQQDDQVQASAMVVPMFNGRDDSPVHAEPLETAYSWSSQEFLDVAAPSIGNQDEGALTTPHCAPQISSICEFPMMSSLFTTQPGMDQLAAVSDVVTPPQANFCLTDSTPNQLAMKVISLLEQKIQEQEQKIQERDRKIVELELENEQLRALTSLS